MKKQSKVRNWHNWEVVPEKLEKGSLTVPGDAMTVRQIFDRHRAGIVDGIRINPYFDDDEEFIPPDRSSEVNDLSNQDDIINFIEDTEKRKVKKDADKQRRDEELNKSKEPDAKKDGE